MWNMLNAKHRLSLCRDFTENLTNKTGCAKAKFDFFSILNP